MYASSKHIVNENLFCTTQLGDQQLIGLAECNTRFSVMVTLHHTTCIYLSIYLYVYTY